MAILKGAIAEIHSIDINRLSLVRDLLWMWIIANAEKEVKIKVWFLRLSVRIKDLHEAFEIILGPKPVDLSVDEKT